MTAWFFVPRVAAAALMTLNVVILTRLLGPAQFGIYNIVLTAGGVGYAFFFGWIAMSVQRFHTAPEFEGEATASAMMLTLVMVGAIAILGAIILPFVDRFPTTLLVLALASFLAHAVHEVGLAGLRVIRAGPAFFAVSILRPVILLVISVLLIRFAGMRVEGAIIAVIVAAGGLGGFGLLLTVRQAGLQVPRAFVFWKFLRFGAPFAIVAAAAMVMSLVAQSLLVKMTGLATAGAYAAASTLTLRAINMPMVMMERAVAADVYRIHDQEGVNAGIARVRQLAPVLMFIAAPIAVVMMAANDAVAGILFGSDHAAIIAPHMPYLAAAALISGFQAAYFSFSFTLSKRTGWQAALNASSVLIHAATCYALIGMRGPIGASQALVITAIYGVSMFFFVGRRFVQINLPARELRIMAPAVLFLWLAAYSAEQLTGVIAPLAMIIVGLAGFYGLLVVCGFVPARRVLNGITRRMRRG